MKQYYHNETDAISIVGDIPIGDVANILINDILTSEYITLSGIRYYNRDYYKDDIFDLLCLSFDNIMKDYICIKIYDTHIGIYNHKYYRTNIRISEYTNVYNYIKVDNVNITFIGTYQEYL